MHAGRPLLVSLLLYLDDRWPRQWDAETLFLDGDTDIGIVVRPKRFRAVLMDQVSCIKKPSFCNVAQHSTGQLCSVKIGDAASALACIETAVGSTWE